MSDESSGWRYLRDEAIRVCDCRKPTWVPLTRIGHATLPRLGRSRDFLAGLPTIGGGLWALAQFAPTRTAAIWGLALERTSGAIDMSVVRACFMAAKQGGCVSCVTGDILTADGRREQAFAGGPGELLLDFMEFEDNKRSAPPALARLLQLDKAGIAVTLLPSSPAVESRWTMQPTRHVVISVPRMRELLETGEVIAE